VRGRSVKRFHRRSKRIAMSAAIITLIGLSVAALVVSVVAVVVAFAAQSPQVHEDWKNLRAILQRMALRAVLTLLALACAGGVGAMIALGVWLGQRGAVPPPLRSPSTAQPLIEAGVVHSVPAIGGESPRRLPPVGAPAPVPIAPEDDADLLVAHQ